MPFLSRCAPTVKSRGVYLPATLAPRMPIRQSFSIRVSAICAAFVAAVLTVGVSMVSPAVAVVDENTWGSARSGTTHFGTQRYHVSSLSFNFRLENYQTQGGAGTLYLYPRKVTDLTAMSPAVSWPVKSGNIFYPNSRKYWNAAPSGYFTLSSINTTGGPLVFGGKISY